MGKRIAKGTEQWAQYVRAVQRAEDLSIAAEERAAREAQRIIGPRKYGSALSPWIGGS